MTQPEGKRGAMYRPATYETYRRVKAYAFEHELSWNAAVNALVLIGLRTVEGPDPVTRMRANRGGKK